MSSFVNEFKSAGDIVAGRQAELMKLLGPLDIADPMALHHDPSLFDPGILPLPYFSPTPVARFRDFHPRSETPYAPDQEVGEPDDKLGTRRNYPRKSIVRPEVTRQIGFAPRKKD